MVEPFACLRPRVFSPEIVYSTMVVCIPKKFHVVIKNIIGGEYGVGFTTHNHKVVFVRGRQE